MSQKPKCDQFGSHFLLAHWCNAVLPMRSQIWDLVPIGTKLSKRSQKSPNFVPKSQRGRVGAKGVVGIFFKNPTTQLRVVWVLMEKKCEQIPKFACEDDLST